MTEAPWTQEFKHCQLLHAIEHFLRHKVILQNLALLLLCIKSVILELTRLDTCSGNKWSRAMHVCVCVRACVCVRPQARSLCPTLCNPTDCSWPGSSVHVIFQAKILEWVAISYSKRSSWPKDGTHVSYVSCTGRHILYHCDTWEAHCEPILIIFSQHLNMLILWNYTFTF